jgi:uncharacterized OB-fold protein
LTLSPESTFVLPERVTPVPDGRLDEQFWAGTRLETLLLQRCSACGGWQWGPEWICFRCGSFDLDWEEVGKSDGRYEGVVYSWERVWHPTTAALASAVPYVALLVTLASAGDCRMMGNLVGDPSAAVSIGDAVYAVFEHHADYSLVQWSRLP